MIREACRATWRDGGTRLAFVMLAFFMGAFLLGKLPDWYGAVGCFVYSYTVSRKADKLLRWINKWERARQRDELAAYVRSEWTAQAKCLIESMERGEIIYVPYRPNETETLN